MSKVTIDLGKEDRDLLSKLATNEYRTVAQQAAYMLRQVLIKSGDFQLDVEYKKVASNDRS